MNVLMLNVVGLDCFLFSYTTDSIPICSIYWVY